MRKGKWIANHLPGQGGGGEGGGGDLRRLGFVRKKRKPLVTVDVSEKEIQESHSKERLRGGGITSGKEGGEESEGGHLADLVRQNGKRMSSLVVT